MMTPKKRWPLGQNWPYFPREFDWEKGNDLDTATELLSHLIKMLDAGRGDEILVDPLTRKPLAKLGIGVGPREVIYTSRIIVDSVLRTYSVG
jgi:hypothetical protein